MADPLSIAVSALGLISFAGQIVEGCASICTFLDAIHDVSDDLRLFRTEVKLFHTLLESYKDMLADIDKGSAERWKLARLALEYSEEAVTEIQKMVNMDAIGPQKRWKHVLTVLRKEKFIKHLNRMERAKTYIVASKNNMALVQELRDCDLAQDMREALDGLSELNSRMDGTSKVISSLPVRLSQVEEHALHTSLAVKSISCSFTEVESTLEQMLQIITDQIPTAEPLQYESSTETISEDLDEKQLPDVSTVRELIHTRGTLAFQPRLGAFLGFYQIINSQKTAVRRGTKMRIGKRATKFTLHILGSLHILRLGLHCSFVWNKSQSVRPSVDIRLHVYHTVDKRSPIIEACESGDLKKVQQLISQGKASPYDRLDGIMSLLDIVFNSILTLPMRRDPTYSLRRFAELLAVFKFLVAQGIDPGQLWSHLDTSPLPFLGGIPFYTTPKFLPLILDLTRTIIEHSIQDPYATGDFTEMLRPLHHASNRTPSPVAALIMNQDCWAPEMEIKEELTPFQYHAQPRSIGNHDALLIRTWLRQGVDHGEAIMSSICASQHVEDMVKYEGLPKPYADELYYHAVFVCVEFGIDLRDASMGRSILELIRERGRLLQLETALRYFEWSEEDIEEMIEGEPMASLVYQLAHLEQKKVKRRFLPKSLGFAKIHETDWDSFLAQQDQDKRKACSSETFSACRKTSSTISTKPSESRNRGNEQGHGGKRRVRDAFPSLRTLSDIITSVYNIVR